MTYLFVAAFYVSICGVYRMENGFALMMSFATQGCSYLCIVCFILHSVACSVDLLACLPQDI